MANPSNPKTAASGSGERPQRAILKRRSPASERQGCYLAGVLVVRRSATQLSVRLLSVIREIHPQVEPYQVQILVEIASQPVSIMRELSDATDVALSSISRNLDVLGDRHWRGGPGLGLVAKGSDPREPRRMIAWLTPRGKEVVSRLLEICST